MPHADVNQLVTRSQIVLTTHKTLFSLCMSLSHIQVAVQMRRACLVDLVCCPLLPWQHPIFPQS